MNMIHARLASTGWLTSLSVAALLAVAGCGGSTGSAHSSRTSVAPTRTPQSSVSGGSRNSVELRANGGVLAWGDNSSGELGDGTTTKRHTPVPVSGLGAGSGVVEVVAGGSHGLVLKRDGTVLAWGNCTSGQLGEGTNGKASAPTRVTGLGSGSGVRAIAAGGSFSLALKADGTVLGWGNNKS